MKQMNLKDQSGVSILEVLIAMIILSMALLVLLNMAMVALDGNDWSNHTTVATQLLQEKMEQLRSSAAGGITSGEDTVSGVVRSWSVSSAGNYLRQVDVKVVWEDIRNIRQTNTMSAFIRTPYI